MSSMLKTMGSLLLSLVFLIHLAPKAVTSTNGPDQQLTILFTHDLHSYMKPVRVAANGEDTELQGGYARLAQLIQDLRARYGDSVLLVDAGDFSIGTLFHSIFPTYASELRVMGQMGYDVVTFGNHELDLHADNLARMLRSAKSSEDRLPELVASNFIFEQSNPRSDDLLQAFKDFPVNEYIILERNELRIGLFGLMGLRAAKDTAFPRDITFEDPIQAAKRMVEKLRTEENVDVVIALSHSGTWTDKSKSEDEILAREVPGIDVIVSGHTHTVLPQPIMIERTFIVSSGCYGAYLGVLQMDFSVGGGGKLIAYDLLEVTDDVEEDPAIARLVSKYEAIVDQDFLSGYDFTAEQVVAESDFNFDTLNQLFEHPGENGLGNLIADAIRYSVQEVEGEHYDYIYATVEPLGMIRSSLAKGDISVSDAFRVLSLGMGSDGEIGIPLVTFYLTGDEIRQMLELESTIGPLIYGDAHLNISGITFLHNPYRVPFNRVMTVKIREEDGSDQSPDPQRLYRVVSNLWAFDALESVNEEAYGILKMTPKDNAGNPILNSQDIILDADIDAEGVQELKEWVALIEYLKSLPDSDGDGIPNIPERYRHPEGRIVVVSSFNPMDLLIGANHITFAVLGISILVLVVFVLLIWGVARLIRRIRVHKEL